jgi:RNA recognition motif-containing protein
MHIFQQSLIGEETQPRTLYVGNLDPQTTEEFLLLLFSQIGPVKGCKIIHEVSLFSFLSFHHEECVYNQIKQFVCEWMCTE